MMSDRYGDLPSNARGPRQNLWYIIRPQLDQRATIHQWANSLGGRVCFVFQTAQERAEVDLSPHETRHVVGDLVPTNSPDEEYAFRKSAEYFATVPAEFESINFYGADLRCCVKQLANVATEYLVRTARGLERVRLEGFDHIVFWFTNFRHYHLAILDEAAALGLCDPQAAVLQVRDGIVVPMPEIFETTTPEKFLPSYLPYWQKGSDEIGTLPARLRPLEPRGVHVLVTTEGAVYLPYIAETIRILRDESIPFRVIVASDSIREKLLALLASDVVADDCIVVFHGIRTSGYSREPDRIRDALSNIFAQIEKRGFSAAPNDGNLKLGDRTLDFVWRHCSTKATISAAYDLCLRIERLAALLDFDKPACLYTYPELSPYDPAPMHLIEARGGISASSIFLSITADYRNLIYPQFHRMTVLGTSQTEALVSRGYPKEQILELGSPLLDEEFANWTYDSARQHIGHILGGAPLRGAIILVATSGFRPDDEFVWIRWLAENLPRDGNVSVVVKLHRSTNAEPYKQLIAEIATPAVFVTQEGEIYPYLMASDIVVSDISHAAKLAVYAGKRLWVANISGTPFPYNRFDEEGVAQLAATRADFAKIVADATGEASVALREEDIARFIRREFTSNDGKARERMAAFFRDCTGPQ